MGTYSVILTCRNSEKGIQQAIMSLINQDTKPEYIIVVDDGSKDKTPVMLKEFQSKNDNLYVITNPDLGYDIGRVVANWNKALRLSKELDLKPTDYHMISTDDTQYEKDYADTIMKYMDVDPSIAIASGNYDKIDYTMPHGAGRFIRNSFFFSFHGYYPEKMGYESVILYTAFQKCLKFRLIPEARFLHTRELGSGHHFYEFGASMRTLGYHPLFALGRFVKYFSSGKPIGRLGAIHMLYHYLSYKPKQEGYDSMHDAEIRKDIRMAQAKRIRRYIGLKAP
jgi:glycosyltransferase involved in cell wall biosynthesis